MKFIEIILPEFILDEECHAGIDNIEELLHIARLVKRKIAHHVGTTVVLAYFVARRRKEGKQDAIVGVLGTDFFYQGTPLLKLAQRSGMKPYIADILFQLLTQKLVHHPVAFHHFAGFAAERCGQVHPNVVKANS